MPRRFCRSKRCVPSEINQRLDQQYDDSVSFTFFGLQEAEEIYVAEEIKDVTLHKLVNDAWDVVEPNPARISFMYNGLEKMFYAVAQVGAHIMCTLSPSSSHHLCSHRHITYPQSL